jgi:hypothetical protein
MTKFDGISGAIGLLSSIKAFTGPFGRSGPPSTTHHLTSDGSRLYRAPVIGWFATCVAQIEFLVERETPAWHDTPL